jgi:hypothetical protein
MRTILWHIYPLLGNDRETNNKTTAIVRRQLPKYQTVLEPLLRSGPRATMDAVFSMLSAPRLYHSTGHVAAGSNITSVALRVVGGDEKGTQCLGV